MKKIYLVKKDPAKEGQDNWITMNGYEFAMFMKTPKGQASLSRNRDQATVQYLNKSSVIRENSLVAELFFIP